MQIVLKVLMYLTLSVCIVTIKSNFQTINVLKYQKYIKYT